jgi:hypothetical protein
LIEFLIFFHSFPRRGRHEIEWRHTTPGNEKLQYLFFKNHDERGHTNIMTSDKGLPLSERLQRTAHIQARRFSKLAGPPLEIATEGIIRHFAACDRMDVNPDISAIREIIDDALNGRRIYAEAA